MRVSHAREVAHTREFGELACVSATCGRAREYSICGRACLCVCMPAQARARTRLREESALRRLDERIARLHAWCGRRAIHERLRNAVPTPGRVPVTDGTISVARSLPLRPNRCSSTAALHRRRITDSAAAGGGATLACSAAAVRQSQAIWAPAPTGRASSWTHGAPAARRMRLCPDAPPARG